MSSSYRLLILFLTCVLWASRLSAFEVFFDPLIWRATESIDWVLINDTALPNQNISYKTIEFDYKPGFRVGGSFNICDWESKLYYTKYDTKATDTAVGNLVTTGLAGKIAQGPFLLFQTGFFQTGQVSFKIDFDMLDWDFGKSIQVTDDLILHPLIGLRGGRINQTIDTNFQGPIISITEHVINNFRGIGPKLGIESKWIFCRKYGHQLSLFADFTTSYMWGRWKIRDIARDNFSRTFDTNVGKRDFGAFTVQGFVGVNVAYECFAMKLGYEIGDWFNQYQVLDDGTGAHNDNLVLQGITLRLSYNF